MRTTDVEKMTYCIHQFQTKNTFSSFLPGVSGMKGIPIWCYYVNRGQGIASFGVQDKDHAIMEFSPAHQAYQQVGRTGFRTFIKQEGEVFEAFSNAKLPHQMTISMNQLEIMETDTVHQLRTKVTYFTLPNEKVGALVRKVTIKNIGQEPIKLEVLDGMPQCLPYGISCETIKMMGQTAKAWMQVEDVEQRTPYYRVRASMKDSSVVTSVLAGNFSLGYLEDGTRLRPIVDPEVIFGYDTALEKPIHFEEQSLETLLNKSQVTQNQLPCSFYGFEATLESERSITYYQMIGQVAHKARLQNYLNKTIDSIYFDKKQREAAHLTSHLCQPVQTKTGSPVFDAYTQYTYMDNVLRGGTPVKLGKNKTFYMYSRKHGDLERDYNFFTVLPEYYSQGNGNFRDVNQNRRLDNFFAPHLGQENIKMFYELIQLDGYNPLLIEKKTYTLSKEAIESIKGLQNTTFKELRTWLTKPFSPGQLMMQLEDLEFEGSKAEKLFDAIMQAATEQVAASFGEGYWSDHWTYNLDLIESYLKIYPEQEETLLFGTQYHYFLSGVKVNPRHKRYQKMPQGIRQYNALEEPHNKYYKLACLKGGTGEAITSTLMEKLLLIAAVKYATLDPYGMGIEMEGGKPGWYDALNGLPGLIGSSMAETYELARHINYTLQALRRYPRNCEIFTELATLIEALTRVTSQYEKALSEEEQVFEFWDAINQLKENYRETTASGIKGSRVTYTSEELCKFLEGWEKVIKRGIEKARQLSGGLYPTYFTYEVTDFIEDESGIWVKDFELNTMPFFLEGPVHAFKLKERGLSAKELYERVKESELFDQKLKMYKVNAPLKETSYEIGRAKAFTPGWLENESIWLHMAYKYLLELLKSGLYKEFFNDFKTSAIPFLNPDVYGRSILENSSFIASSANPNEAYHGKGFVARLSGSTIEFLNMWQVMMFGPQLFECIDGKLKLTLSPIIPQYLIDDTLQISATLLSHTKVVYHFESKKDYIPGNYVIKSIKMRYFDDSICEVSQGYLTEKFAEDVRNGKVITLDIHLKDQEVNS